MNAVPIGEIILQLTIIEQNARAARENLALAEVVSRQAKKPQIELAGADIAGRLGGAIPSAAAQKAEQAARFGHQSQVAIQNVIGHTGVLHQLLTTGADNEGSAAG